MKLHVFTTRISASAACGVSSYPSRERMPIITSLSTRFFGHPRLTNPTFVLARVLLIQVIHNYNTRVTRTTAWVDALFENQSSRILGLCSLGASAPLSLPGCSRAALFTLPALPRARRFFSWSVEVLSKQAG